jgi:hypothetical protein
MVSAPEIADIARQALKTASDDITNAESPYFRRICWRYRTFEGEDHIQIYCRIMKSSKKIDFYNFNRID